MKRRIRKKLFTQVVRTIESGKKGFTPPKRNRKALVRTLLNTASLKPCKAWEKNLEGRLFDAIGAEDAE